MIIFQFKDHNDFDKAVKALKQAVEFSPDYDHSVQEKPEEPGLAGTITVVKEKGAELIDKLLKKNNLKYEKETDLSWVGPEHSVASVIRHMACRMKLSAMNQVIECQLPPHKWGGLQCESGLMPSPKGSARANRRLEWSRSVL